ncbi:hypothetical protein [Phocaeicola sp.]
MKKRNLITVVFLSIMTIGCTQDEVLETMSNDDSISNEIKKIETLFARNVQEKKNVSIYPDDSRKDESVYSDDSEKIETSMSYEDKLVYYDYINRNKLEKTVSNLNPTNRYTGTDGLVLKPKGIRCFPYDELILVMDCEDHKERSYVSGNTGETFVDGNGNVHFFFCIVPSGMTYGGGLNQFVWDTTRYFDCEDSNNDNRFYLNGYRLANGLTNSSLGIQEDDRGNITFYFNFAGSSSDGFGRFGTSSDPSRNGVIYTDDEDDNNANTYHPLIISRPDWNHNTLLNVYF